MSLTFFALPLLLLVFFQVGFLPYHSSSITWWHRFILVADTFVLVVYFRYLRHIGRSTKLRLSGWVHEGIGRARVVVSRLSLRIFGRHYGTLIARVAGLLFRGTQKGSTFAIRYVSPNRIVIGVMLLFSFCVATLPDDDLDKAMASIPYLSERLPYGEPKEKMVDNKEHPSNCPAGEGAARCAFYLTAYLFEHQVNQATGKSGNWLGWSRNLIVTDKDLVEDDKKEKQLSLRGRDLRYATLDRSDVKRSDLFEAKLDGARLVQANLNAANLRKANLQGADLSEASLEGANLSHASLLGANLSKASLQGANLGYASLQGALLFQASLQGSDLGHARLHGANLSGANLQGADLDGAGLQGAILFGARLQGASLVGTGLQGADLGGARLQGAHLVGAGLQGAYLVGASLQGANVVGAKIWNTPLPVALDGASFLRLEVRALDSGERQQLGKTLAELLKLHQVMKQERIPGSEQVNVALTMLDAGVGPLLKTAGQDKWKAGDEDLKAWCGLERRPPPDSARLGRYLGRLACTDDTEKAYMAQQLINRISESTASAFVEAFKGCPAVDRIPSDMRSGLEKTAQQVRANRERIELAQKAARFACTDATDMAYAARLLVVRALRQQPETFLETFRGCPTNAGLPGDLKSLLSLAAIREQRKRLLRSGSSTPSEPPKICASPKQ
jgi:uncharacterized protein YjbI with pentapeptide repeats